MSPPDGPDDAPPEDGSAGDGAGEDGGDDFEWGGAGTDEAGTREPGDRGADAGTDDPGGDSDSGDPDAGAAVSPDDAVAKGDPDADDDPGDPETDDPGDPDATGDAGVPGADAASGGDPAATGDDDPLLAIRDLSVSYGKTRALSGVSVSVERGEIVGVIGPNGAGKTTLLEAVGGFVDYEGTIRFDGRDLSGVDPTAAVERGLIYCTEDRDLFPFFSVHENLLMGAQARDDREAVRDDLAMVYDLFPRLDDRRDQDAETMSGGEQQMLAIGRALMGDPELLMLDEPTLGLAPVIVEDISDAIERLREEGLTIFLAEQNSTFALDHADRLALLENGSVRLSGTVDEFRDNEYVRDAYIGIH